MKLCIVGFLTKAAWTDWKTKRIPDDCVLGIMVCGVGNALLIPEISLRHRFVGMFLVSVPLLLLTCIIPGSIGGGDIKLMAAGGFLLGNSGIWNAFVTGVMIAGIYCLIVLFGKKAGRKSEIALGPFLSIGMILALFNI